jgi:8-amino-7-oxononanoate synthase
MSRFDQSRAPRADRKSALAQRLSSLEEFRRLRATMAGARRAGLRNPYFRCYDGIAGDSLHNAGVECVNFSTYNYLGLSGHPYVVRAAQQAIARYGTSVSASRLVAGERPLHAELERALARWVGTEDALAFVSGHATNVTTLGHLLGPEDLVLHDVLAHNSIVEGCRLSGASRRAFPHNDHEACERLLGRIRADYRHVLIAIEGVYSMDGDYPNLPAFIEVKRRYDAFLYVDEAHALGTMGPRGRGIAEHFAIDPQEIDLWMGTLSKALGSCGGYVAGDREVIEFLKYTVPGFVFSVGITPANAAAALAALEVLQQEPQRVARLQDNASLFLDAARAAGLNCGSSGDTPIVPILLGGSGPVLVTAEKLLAAGINVSPILPPAVSERGARLRFFLTSEHTPDQIELAVETLASEQCEQQTVATKHAALRSA